VPLHDRQHCFCKSGKKYRKCCKKRRYFYRESLDSEIPPPKVCADPNIIKMMISTYTALQARSEAAGESPEETAKIPFFPSITAEQNGALITKAAMEAIVASGGKIPIDRCFFWCLKHPQNDICFARLWRKAQGPFMFDKTELALRRDQWNGWVDEYIALMKVIVAQCVHVCCTFDVSEV
jgi:hypothetical protein